MHRQYWKGSIIRELKEDEIFVFGSNPEGRHGAGAAKDAKDFGAKTGFGRGLNGQTYGLITKNLKSGFTEKATGITYQQSGKRSVSLDNIRKNIQELYNTARQNPKLKFLITFQHETDQNGNPKSSLNGYTSKEMKDQFLSFNEIPENIVFHISYLPFIQMKHQKITTLDEKIKLSIEEKKENKKLNFLGLNKKHLNDGDTIVPFFGSTNIMSQRHPSLFSYKGKQFISCEQFMMYSKAKLFNDEDIAFKILDINHSNILIKNFIEGKTSREDIIYDKTLLKKWNRVQQDIKNLGKQVSGFQQSIWDNKKFSIVNVASREKFQQNNILLDLLLSTDNAILIEASPYDKIWGIGLSKNDPKLLDKLNWQGQNLLGQAIMNTRTLFNNNTLNNRSRKKIKP